ncbi:hypothetical protein Tco_1405384 [Tanacetum coccineum]
MTKGWCGQAYKDLLWRSAFATSVKEFEMCMLELKKMNPKAHEWLKNIPPEHLARSLFQVIHKLRDEQCRAKSDLLFNNIWEVFNVVRCRDRPVITLLEYIRVYCMKRIVNIQSVVDKCTGPLTPTATRIMEYFNKEAHLMKVQWNVGNKYQVLGLFGDQCVMDVMAKTCPCRKYELTGIPCMYVVTACWNMALNDRATPPLEAWVNSCYWLTTSRETYSHKVGRPKKKRKRSKHEDEPFVKDGKLSKKGRTIACQSCENIRHNKATCKGQGRKETTGGNNAKASGLFTADGQGGAGVGVGSKGSSHTRWTKRRVQTEIINGREVGDGIPTQSNAAGGASEWSFLDKGKPMMPVDEDMSLKKISPLAKEIMVMTCKLLQNKNTALYKGKSMMHVEDDMGWYSNEMKEHA